MEMRDDILTTLRALRDELNTRFRVREISLFGSVVHEKETSSSDIDLLVDFDEQASLFDLVGLGIYLEETFGRKVDIVPRESLRPEIRDAVLAEAIVV
jgi:predicted nucleotidyltransferase